MRHTIILLALLCAACSSYTLKPYKMDIQQGNVVTSKMMLQLRPGMNKSQVRFIMGTPLIQDSFHRDRWDYFYQMSKGGKVIEQRRVILDFEGDALKRVRGDVIPAGTGDVAEPSPVTPTPGKKSAKPEEKKGLLDKLKFWKGDEEDANKPQAAPTELVSPAAVSVEQAPAPAKTAPQAPAEPAGEPDHSAPAAAPVEPAAATPEVTQNPPPVRQMEVPAQQEAPKPAPEEAAPAPAPARNEVVKPAESKPAESKPVESKPAAQPSTKAEPKPAAKPASKPAPVEEDLPPEDAPGYFERMLEKIGF